jgi:hypothetical protein
MLQAWLPGCLCMCFVCGLWMTVHELNDALTDAAERESTSQCVSVNVLITCTALLEQPGRLQLLLIASLHSFTGHM